MADVQLDLPPTPLPPLRTPLSIPPMSPSPSPMSPSPQTALTFTAEWDLTQRAFVFNPFETSYPLSATSIYPTVSPVPDDVISVADTVAVGEGAERGVVEVVPASPSSSVTTPCSEIFDDVSVYSQDDVEVKELDSSAPTSASVPSLSPHGLYSKSEGSSSSLARQITLHTFQEELNRSIHSESNESDFDKGCYEEMDDDLLLAPMSVFERMLWDSTVVESRLSKSSVHNILPPDVPFSLSTESVPLLPSESGYTSTQSDSPDSPHPPHVTFADIIPPPPMTVASHGRNLSFSSFGIRQRPKGPRLRRNFSADIAGAFRLKY